MKFRDFQAHVKDLPAFNLNDVRNFDPDFHRQQFSDWLDRRYIKPLAGGYYLLVDAQVDESTLFMLANRIYEPSYISRESALAHYLVIPESVLGVTSVSSRKTKQFDSEWGRLSYRSIKPILMFGYQVVEQDKKIKYKIASLEKAVLDYLYWNTGINSSEDLVGLRWNRQELLGLEDNPSFWKYLKVFENKALERRVDVVMEYIHA
jgi:predicted transcriptional regulator of viral defense system